MKAKTIFLFSALLLFAACLFPAEAAAQCAMCRAGLEVNASAGEQSVGGALNRAILFLLASPYALIGVAGFLWYRHSLRQREKRQRIQSRLGL